MVLDRFREVLRTDVGRTREIRDRTRNPENGRPRVLAEPKPHNQRVEQLPGLGREGTRALDEALCHLRVRADVRRRRRREPLALDRTGHLDTRTDRRRALTAVSSPSGIGPTCSVYESR